MKDIKWLINRLKAMHFKEVIWRVQQKILQCYEKMFFYKRNVAVTERHLNFKLSNLKINIDNMPINWKNREYEVFKELHLFGIFSYSEYKKKWNAGFQTENSWPENEFSYQINCNQRTDIGDIRTNWELNRHYQFSALAKSYYVTGNKDFLIELEDLFLDWNKHNLFLHGVEWTSAMEIAIRVNSWIYTYCFLEKAFQNNEEERNTELLRQLSHGILVMVDYIVKHRSRYSSANNHLIVEMYAVALAGLIFEYRPWVKIGIEILTKELPRQNYSDGVNREMSLHYQCFIMEAYGLIMLAMIHNNERIPLVWFEYLASMSGFLADCCGDYGEVIVFGDNDEGKLLDLVGEKFNYYHYVSDLMSCILKTRYTDLNHLHENIKWLFDEEEINYCGQKNKYVSQSMRCYADGGYTLLKDLKKGVLIGIDHAELGFGTLAAHGHADALSFQLYAKGEPIFVDAGTYNYHFTPEDRDKYRSTKEHNTVLINNENQSELLGPFLWGRKAKSSFEEQSNTGKNVLIASHDGYKNVTCKRKFEYSEEGIFVIEDTIDSDSVFDAEINFLLGPTVKVKEIDENTITIENDIQKISFHYLNGLKMCIEDSWYSDSYNSRVKTKRICLQRKKTNAIRSIVKIQFLSE